MLFANDYNDNRIHIDDTQSNKEYYCPYCGAPVVTKKAKSGNIILLTSKVTLAKIAGNAVTVMIFHHGTMNGKHISRKKIRS